MNKINFKILIITCIIIVLPMLFGIYYYNSLPDRMAIHFDINNNPNNYMSKSFVVFGIPILLTLLQIVCCIISDIGDKNKEANRKIINVSKWIIPIACFVSYVFTIYFNLNYKVDIRSIVCALIGFILIILGNYLPKSRQSTWPSIKRILIMGDEKLYRKYTKIMGYLMIFFGLLFIISIILPPTISKIIIGCFIISTLFVQMVIYYLYHKK